VSCSVDETPRMRQRYARLLAVDDEEVCKTRNEAEELIAKWTNWKQQFCARWGGIDSAVFRFHEHFSVELYAGL